MVPKYFRFYLNNIIRVFALTKSKDPDDIFKIKTKVLGYYYTFHNSSFPYFIVIKKLLISRKFSHSKSLSKITHRLHFEAAAFYSEWIFSWRQVEVWPEIDSLI